jgi:uncharacterized protein (TIGR03083 family)
MIVTEVRDEVAAERRELAAVLGDLPPGSWQMPSLCAGWRVREVVAHITMLFRYSAAKFMAELVRSRGQVQPDGRPLRPARRPRRDQ